MPHFGGRIDVDADVVRWTKQAGVVGVIIGLAVIVPPEKCLCRRGRSANPARKT
jgi:hypothetical protein